MKKYFNVINLFRILIVIIIFSFFSSVYVLASPLNDFEVNMNISNGVANIDISSSDVDRVIAGNENFFDNFLRQYKSVIVGFFGISSLTCVLIFVLNFISLANSSGNAMNRGKALTALLWSGISAAILGGVSLFVGFSYGFLR